MALIAKAAGRGHAYAMWMMGSIYSVRKEYEQAVQWFTQGAEAGLPRAMLSLAICLDNGWGVVAPDYSAAADWYRHAADAGNEGAAATLSTMYTVGRGGVWHIMPATPTTTCQSFSS
jgi:TPR repeat protein